jgi:hypothetical protein
MLFHGLTTRGTERIYRRLPRRPAGVSRQLWRYQNLRVENLAAGLTAAGKQRAAVNWRRTNPLRRAWTEFRAAMNITMPEIHGTVSRSDPDAWQTRKYRGRRDQDFKETV